MKKNEKKRISKITKILINSKDLNFEEQGIFEQEMKKKRANRRQVVEFIAAFLGVFVFARHIVFDTNHVIVCALIAVELGL